MAILFIQKRRNSRTLPHYPPLSSLRCNDSQRNTRDEVKILLSCSRSRSVGEIENTARGVSLYTWLTGWRGRGRLNYRLGAAVTTTRATLAGQLTGRVFTI